MFIANRIRPSEHDWFVELWVERGGGNQMIGNYVIKQLADENSDSDI